MTASENPFAAERLARLAFRFSGGGTWATVLNRLEALNYTGAIVGARGSGKSTLINLLRPHLEDRGFEPVYFRLTSKSSMRQKERLGDSFRHLKPPQIILIDGAEQLSTRHWLFVRAAASSAGGLIVTVNRVSRLPVVFESEPSMSLLHQLAEDLSGAPFDKATAESLFMRHRGNIRDCLTELGETWSQQNEAAKETASDHAG